MSNCYAHSLGRVDLGELRPGDLGLKFGRLTPAELRKIRQNGVSGDLSSFNKGCLQGWVADGLEILDSPPKDDKSHLVGLFTKILRGGFMDFHLAAKYAGHKEWTHGFKVCLTSDDPPFLDVQLADPEKFSAEGLHGYQFLTFAKVSADLRETLKL